MTRDLTRRLAGSTRILTPPLLLFLLLGCSDTSGGPKTMRVWGAVNVDGTPLEEGTIDFLAGDGAHPAQGQIQAGYYDIPASAGPEAGKDYRVEISALKKFGKPLRNVMGDGEPTMQPMINTIPPEYNVSSTLKVKVLPESGSNKFDFTIKTPAGKKGTTVAK